MITLITIINIWFFISLIRIKKASKGREFSPFNATFIDYMGFGLGAAVLIMTIIALFIFFLP